MKHGIILAGGTGSRLYPLTNVVNKHLLPVNSKFIIDYPISTIKNCGVENITIVLGGAHFSQVVNYLQDGSQFGLNFNYVYQKEPSGIAQAINICKQQINSNKFIVTLGDNIFEKEINFKNKNGAQIVLSKHNDLKRFGVAKINKNKIISIEEKPKNIDLLNDSINDIENLAITGCYLFDDNYFDYFKSIKPSARGEYEITDIIKQYNNDNKLNWVKYSGLWSDAGTHESINFINNYFYENKYKTI